MFNSKSQYLNNRFFVNQWFISNIQSDDKYSSRPDDVTSGDERKLLTRPIDASSRPVTSHGGAMTSQLANAFDRLARKVRAGRREKGRRRRHHRRRRGRLESVSERRLLIDATEDESERRTGGTDDEERNWDQRKQRHKSEVFCC